MIEKERIRDILHVNWVTFSINKSLALTLINITRGILCPSTIRLDQSRLLGMKCDFSESVDAYTKK